MTRSSADKLAGYRRALDEAGEAFGAEPVEAAGGFAVEAGRVAAGTLLGRRPALRAVVAAADTLALGLVQVAQQRGARCPDDLAVTGFYDGAVTLEVDRT